MKKYFIVTMLLVCTGAAFVSFINHTAANKDIPFPDGYRRWTNVKTSIAGYQNPEPKKFDGYHHIYANDKAMTGYPTGNFPDGAIIVFDVQEIITTKNGIEPGSRKFIDVMVKHNTLYKDTGGWGFEEFSGDSKSEGRLNLERQQKCFNCHSSQKDSDFVFSQYKE